MVKIFGVLIVLAALAGVYMFLMHLTPRDFVRLPDGVLDDAIYYAQQHDLKQFKRLFTKDVQEKMQKMHDSNINRESEAGMYEQEELFWTWDTLMSRMEKFGGFEVLPSSTKFLDYVIDGEMTLVISFHDKASDTDKQRNFKLYRNDLVWRIDLQNDPDFIKAYNQSVRQYRTNENGTSFE